MRRASRRLAIAAIAVGGVGLAGWWLATTGRAPVLSRALQAVSSAVSSPSDSASSGTVTLDGDAVATDAAPRPHRQAGPLSSAQLGAPLVNGHFVTACGAPDNMKVTVKATVKMGRAVAVDVTTDPPDPGVRTCVEKFTRDQRWDISPKAGHMTVRY